MSLAGVLAVVVLLLLLLLLAEPTEEQAAPAALAPATTTLPATATATPLTPPLLGDVQPHLVGTWQSVPDSASVLVLQATGTVEQWYNGERLDTGTWYATSTVPAAYAGVEAYLVQSYEDDTLYYGIFAATETALVLNHLARGNMLEYRRIPTAPQTVPGERLPLDQ